MNFNIDSVFNKILIKIIEDSIFKKSVFYYHEIQKCQEIF